MRAPSSLGFLLIVLVCLLTTHRLGQAQDSPVVISSDLVIKGDVVVEGRRGKYTGEPGIIDVRRIPPSKG